ncbi:MAG: hypothetical protein HDS57_01475 [Barnesiella sp.]|nr:hypothetical protein [Barnesiella sp.]
MKQIILIILSILALAGCHTSKIATNLSAEKREKFVADSIKYEAVKEAFTKCEFVFKINQDGKVKVNPLDNWMIFSTGKVRYQYSYNNTQPPRSYAGEIRDLKQISDSKKKTITLIGNVIAHFPFRMTLYEGSDKAYGYIGGYGDTLCEGWIEPLNDATIVRGWESPIYK